MLWQKQQNVEKMLDAYFDKCDACYSAFEAAFDLYFAQGPTDEFCEHVEHVHRAEAACDDMRREIEYLLYGKALLPESRGDLLGLLETYDKLPNIAETVAYMFSCQRVTLPPELHDNYRALLVCNLESYRRARRAVDALMSNPKATLHATKDIEHQESESDRLERELIRLIFQREESMGEKLVMKECVLLLGEISDRAERVGDRVAITAIKRQI